MLQKIMLLQLCCYCFSQRLEDFTGSVGDSILRIWLLIEASCGADGAEGTSGMSVPLLPSVLLKLATKIHFIGYRVKKFKLYSSDHKGVSQNSSLCNFVCLFSQDLVSLVVEEEFQKCENSALCFPVPLPHPVILEIGCGSGAIALSLLCKLPQVSSLQCSWCNKCLCYRTIPLWQLWSLTDSVSSQQVEEGYLGIGPSPHLSAGIADT